MHALVSALRTDGAQPTAPAPGIEDLDDLVGAARATGLTVSTAVEGRVHVVPAVVEVAAARIVQESLTNVVRHSHAKAAAVHITYGPHALSVAIEDEGPAAGVGAGPGGSGIAGMRERARALGGDLSARRHGAGFAVHATFPLPSPPPETDGAP